MWRNRDYSGPQGTAPTGVTSFHGNYGIDEVFVRTFRTRPTPPFGRKQDSVLSFSQHAVEMQQSGRFQNNSGTKDTCRAHEQRSQPGDDPIGGAQVGRTLAPAIEDQQLMPHQHGLSNNGTEDARPCQSRHRRQQMNQEDKEVPQW